MNRTADFKLRLCRRPLCSVDVHELSDFCLCQHTHSHHDGTRRVRTDRDVTHTETALYPSSVLTSVPLLTAVLDDARVEVHSQFQTHVHTLIQSHTQNCVFWQDRKTGDYTHAADAGISLSCANPVSFALERVREREREKDKRNINFISTLW